ncbi:hypothetical protein HYE68_006516 [Fusarium pseudograminearum]|nr:hypothetical protein HYE68_006516 [Fusarium pseudograminearum]
MSLLSSSVSSSASPQSGRTGDMEDCNPLETESGQRDNLAFDPPSIYAKLTIAGMPFSPIEVENDDG